MAPTNGELHPVTPALCNEAIESFGVKGIKVVATEGVLKVEWRQQLPNEATVTVADNTIRSMVVALVGSYINGARWLNCSGYFEKDGTRKHDDACPLHHGH
jgi:hypothetical protein